MSAQILPSILVPLVGLVFPAIAMASLFLYIEKEQISQYPLIKTAFIESLFTNKARSKNKNFVLEVSFFNLLFG